MSKSPITKDKTAKVARNKVPKQAKPELIRDVKLLTKQIEEHITAGSTWQAKTQQLLISAAFLPLTLNKNGEMTGQITPLIRLAEGTSTLTHKNAVAKWIETYAPVVIKGGELKFSAAKAKKMMEKGEHEAIDALLNSIPYFKLIPADKPFDGFDLRAKLAGLLKQAKKMQKALDENAVEVKGDTIELNDNLRKKIIVSKEDVDTIESLLAHKSADGVPAVVLH